MSTGAPNARSTSRESATSSSRTSSPSAGPSPDSPGVNSTTARVRLGDDDRVGRDHPRDHRLAEAGRRVDEQLVRPAADRVAGEDDGRGPCRDQRLDHDRHRVAVEGQPAPRPVADRRARSTATPSSEGRRAPPRRRSAPARCRAARRSWPPPRPRPRSTSGRRAGSARHPRRRSRSREPLERCSERGGHRRREGAGDHRLDERAARVSGSSSAAGSARSASLPGRLAACTANASVVRQNPGGIRNP